MADKETPKSAVATSENGKTIESVITEASKDLGKNPEELLKGLKEKGDKEKLQVKLDTQKKVDDLKQEVRKTFLEHATNSDSYLGHVIDSLVQRQKAEKTINELPGVKDVLQGVETVQDLRELKAEQLVRLEDKYEGILMYAFTDIVGDAQKLDFKNWKGYLEPAAGTKFQVDFRGNPHAEKLIGAADLLPPSVRAITIYDDGDKNRARASERRVGLKGQNKSGNGFYDKNGYMAVYSGDVMEIGAPDKAYADQFFKKPDGSLGTLDEEAYKRYAESEEGKKDKDFLVDLYKRNPNAQHNKVMSQEEIQALMDRIETSGTGKKIVEALMQDVEKRDYMPKHCWDWVNHVYQSAGVSGKTRIYQDLNYEGADCGDHHASPEMMDRIAPGDWLYINNKNTADSHGNHSVIFIEWINKDTGEARVASGSYNVPGRLQKTNLKEKPVVSITKPGGYTPEVSANNRDVPNIQLDESKSVVEQMKLDKLSPMQRENAMLIEQIGKEKGLKSTLIAALVLNAKRESNLGLLNVGDHGHSVGLFQLNNVAGVIRGKSIDEYRDPRVNIETFIDKEVFGSFGKSVLARAEAGASVSELAALVTIKLERPRDKAGEAQKSIQLAKKYFGGNSESQNA